MTASTRRGTAIVTGAAQGIGLATARALGQAGFDVALASLEALTGEALTAIESSAGGGRLRYYRFDVADLSQHAGLLDQVTAEIGQPMCLVNNAGVSSLVRGDLLELTPESFDRSFQVNLRGAFFLTQAFAKRRMRVMDSTSANAGCIINIGSVNAEVVGGNRGDYCMSKAALGMMTKLFAARLAKVGIPVFEIRPGIIRTDMTAPAVERYDGLIEDGGIPMPRWGLPKDIADAAVMLACGGLPYATGIHLDVAGGLQLHCL